MQGFKILGINHIGIAPKDPAASHRFFSQILGLADQGEELVKEQRTLTQMFRSSNVDGLEHSNSIEPRLELLIPADQPTDQTKSPIAVFLEKKGSGIHHIALQVDHVQNAIVWLKSQGVKMIDEVPRPGAHKTSIAFVHPSSTGGVLVELVEESAKTKSL